MPPASSPCGCGDGARRRGPRGARSRTSLPGACAGRHRTTLLSPFDSLLWHRARAERIFGFRYVFEAYVPAPKRRHGYYVMPLLARGRLAGRVDPGRSGRTLVAKQVSVEPTALDDMATALVEAASWVGCDGVAIERVEPTKLRASLRAAIRALA